MKKWMSKWWDKVFMGVLLLVCIVMLYSRTTPVSNFTATSLILIWFLNGVVQGIDICDRMRNKKDGK